MFEYEYDTRLCVALHLLTLPDFAGTVLICRKKPCQYDLFCAVLALLLFVCGLTSLLNI